MSTRASDLKPTAQQAAEDLASRYGSLKHMLSAAVLAFDWLAPEVREVFMKRADDKEAPLPDRPTDTQKAADLFWPYLPAEIQQMLVNAVRGERPLDVLWLEMTREGLQRGLEARKGRLPHARGSKGRRPQT
jgi:hypothetical protein